MARLFFGLWPDPQVRAAIGSFSGSLALQAARPVPTSNTHITLAFLGNVEAETCEALVAGAGSIRIAAFSLSLDSLGWWKKPKIAWLAPSSCPHELRQLAQALQDMSRACGVSLEDRPYRPHLTLARKVTKPLPASQLEPISWNINEFCLLESKSRESGVEYQVKESWPLKIM